MSLSSLTSFGGLLVFFLSPVYALPNDVQAQNWLNLNKTINGRLQAATPLSRPCFSQLNGIGVQRQDGACVDIQKNYTADFFRVNEFSGYPNIQSEACEAQSNSGCVLNPSLPTDPTAFTGVSCNQGALPPFYIEVTGPKDVKAAFSFAANTRTPLVIKNSGHDYNGRSSGPGTLALWTRNLQNLTYHPAFVPSGCTGQQGIDSITTGAGINFNQVYKFADQNNVTFVGGSAPTVGVSGGWVMTGGHGVLTNALGLGVDRVLEFEVVTPKGDHLFANSCQNQDLFWALRGGGGGTFGVVLATTHRVAPAMSLSVVTTFLPSTANSTIQGGFLDIVAKSGVKWANEGWGGFQSAPATVLVTPLLSLSAANGSMAEAMNYATSHGGTATIETVPNFYAFVQKYVLSLAQPGGFASFSHVRSIPLSLWSTDSGRKQVRAHMDWMASVGLAPGILATAPVLYSTNGSSIAKAFAYGPADSVSTTPSWRSSAMMLNSGIVWPYNATTAEKKKVVAIFEEATRREDILVPGGGAYANEAHPWVENWEEQFWGANYGKLLVMKKKFDPAGLLSCLHCVGSKATTPVGGVCLGSLGS